MQKDASAEGSSLALAAAQQKHVAAVEALLESHAAAVEKMQARPLCSSRFFILRLSERAPEQICF